MTDIDGLIKDAESKMTPAERYARALDRLINHYRWDPEDAVQFLEKRMQANDRQVGGEHYKKGGEEHWDRAWRLNYDCFQYIITKWVERWKEKGGIQDLLKAQHAIEKYIEVVQAETPATPARDVPDVPVVPFEQWAGGPKPGHIFNYGPNPLVKPDGWVGFVFEGIDAYGALFTCRQCHAKVRCAANHCPHDYHKHDDDGADPDHRYTNQD